MAASGEGQVLSVCLEGGSPFGLRLTGGNGRPIVVSKLHRCSKASDGGVMIGDRLLAINDFQCSDNMRLQTATDLLNVIHYTTALRLLLFRPDPQFGGDYYSSCSSTPRNLSRPSSAYSSRQSSRSTTPTFDSSTPIRAEEPAEYHYVMAPSRPSAVYSSADESCRYSGSSSSGISTSPYNSGLEDRNWGQRPGSASRPTTAPLQTDSRSTGSKSTTCARDEVFEEYLDDPDLKKHVIVETKREPFGDRVLTKVVREERSLFGEEGRQGGRRGSLAQYELTQPGQREVPSWYSTRRLSQGSIYQPGSSRSLDRSEIRKLMTPPTSAGSRDSERINAAYRDICESYGNQSKSEQNRSEEFSHRFTDNRYQSREAHSSTRRMETDKSMLSNKTTKSNKWDDSRTAQLDKPPFVDDSEEFEDTEQVSYLASTLCTAQRSSSRGPVVEGLQKEPSKVHSEANQMNQVSSRLAENASHVQITSIDNTELFVERDFPEVGPPRTKPLRNTNSERVIDSEANSAPSHNGGSSTNRGVEDPNRNGIGKTGLQPSNDFSTTLDLKLQQQFSHESHNSITPIRQRPTRRQSADASIILRPYQPVAPPIINISEFSGDEKSNSSLDVSDALRQSPVKNSPGNLLTANDPRISQWNSNQQNSTNYMNSPTSNSSNGQLPPASEMAKKLLSGEDVHEVVIWASKPDLDDVYSRGRRRRRFSTSQLTMSQSTSKPQDGCAYGGSQRQMPPTHNLPDGHSNNPTQMQSQNYTRDGHQQPVDVLASETQQTYRYTEGSDNQRNVSLEAGVSGVKDVKDNVHRDKNLKPGGIGYDLICNSEDTTSGYPLSDNGKSTLTVTGSNSPSERPSTPTRLAIFVAKPGEEDLMLTEDNVKFETLQQNEFEHLPKVRPSSCLPTLGRLINDQDFPQQNFNLQQNGNLNSRPVHFRSDAKDAFGISTPRSVSNSSVNKSNCEFDSIQNNIDPVCNSTEQKLLQNERDPRSEYPERKSPSQFIIPEPPPPKPVKTYDVQSIYEPPRTHVRRHSVSLSVGRLSTPMLPGNMDIGQQPKRNGIAVRQQNPPGPLKSPMTPWESVQQYGDVSEAFEHVDNYQRRRFSDQVESMTAAYDRQSSRESWTNQSAVMGRPNPLNISSNRPSSNEESNWNNSAPGGWKYGNALVSTSQQAPSMGNMRNISHNQARASPGKPTHYSNFNDVPNKSNADRHGCGVSMDSDSIQPSRSMYNKSGQGQGSMYDKSGQGQIELDDSQPSFTINVSSGRSVTAEPTISAPQGFNKPRQRFSLDANISRIGSSTNGGISGGYSRDDCDNGRFGAYILTTAAHDEKPQQWQPMQLQSGTQKQKNLESQRRDSNQYGEQKHFTQEREQWGNTNRSEALSSSQREQHGDLLGKHQEMKRPLQHDLCPDQFRLPAEPLRGQENQGYQSWQPKPQQQSNVQHGSLPSQQVGCQLPRQLGQQAAYRQSYQQQRWLPQQQQQQQQQQWSPQKQQLQRQQWLPQQQQLQQQWLPQQEQLQQQQWLPQLQMQQQQLPVRQQQDQLKQQHQQWQPHPQGPIRQQPRTSQSHHDGWTPLPVKHISTGSTFARDPVGFEKIGFDGNVRGIPINPRERPASAMMVSSPPVELSRQSGYRGDEVMERRGREWNERAEYHRERGRNSAVGWLGPRYNGEGTPQ